MRTAALVLVLGWLSAGSLAAQIGTPEDRFTGQVNLSWIERVPPAQLVEVAEQAPPEGDLAGERDRVAVARLEGPD